jgi:hypothetical protein
MISILRIGQDDNTAMEIGVEYVCDACGKRYETDPDWTEADARREAKLRFGSAPPKDMHGWAVICDDCNKLMMEKLYGREH